MQQIILRMQLVNMLDKLICLPPLYFVLTVICQLVVYNGRCFQNGKRTSKSERTIDHYIWLLGIDWGGVFSKVNELNLDTYGTNTLKQTERKPHIYATTT